MANCACCAVAADPLLPVPQAAQEAEPFDSMAPGQPGEVGGELTMKAAAASGPPLPLGSSVREPRWSAGPAGGFLVN